MALYALPTINQGSRPPGVPGQSRDDLALGQPVIITDSGIGPTRSWVLVDKPEGSNAGLSSSTGPSTQFTPDVVGSYRVQLQVNGGPTSDHIAYVIAAVQVALPSWITGHKNLVRIPAWGERLDFNVKSSPGLGVNRRGWAYEMEQFFKTIADYGFGIVLKSDGSLVTGEPSYQIDFQAGLQVTDLGGGMIGVSLGDHNGLGGRDESDCHPADSISLDDSGFTDNLIGVTDVQQMAVIVDGLSGGSLMVANTIFVTKEGHDVTGQRGNKSKPFLTIGAAFGAAQDGDLILIGPGLFSEGTLTVPNVLNLFVVGSGPGVTIVRPDHFRRLSSAGMDQLLLAHLTFRRKDNTTQVIANGTACPGGYFNNGGIGLTIYNVHDECESNNGYGVAVYECSLVNVIDVKWSTRCGNWRIGSPGMTALFKGCRWIDAVFNYQYGVSPEAGTFEFKDCHFTNGIPIQVVAGAGAVKITTDASCEFVNCLNAIVIGEDDDDVRHNVDLVISGRFLGSTISARLSNYYEGKNVYVSLDGVHKLEKLELKAFEGSYNSHLTTEIANSSIRELVVYQSNGELPIGSFNCELIVRGCSSCFDTVNIESQHPDQPSNSLIEFKNCSITVPMVDGWSLEVRGGYVDSTSFQASNGGTMIVYTPDGSDSQTFTGGE